MVNGSWKRQGIADTNFTNFHELKIKAEDEDENEDENEEENEDENEEEEESKTRDLVSYLEAGGAGAVSFW
jgi:hypothetical protein